MWWSSGSDRKWWSRRTSFESKRHCWEHCHRCGGRLRAAFSAKEADNKKTVRHWSIREENGTDWMQTLTPKDTSFCQWDCWQQLADWKLWRKHWEKFGGFPSNTMNTLLKILCVCLKASCLHWTPHTLVSHNSGDISPLHDGRDCGVQRAVWPMQ